MIDYPHCSNIYLIFLRNKILPHLTFFTHWFLPSYSHVQPTVTRFTSASQQQLAGPGHPHNRRPIYIDIYIVYNIYNKSHNMSIIHNSMYHILILQFSGHYTTSIKVNPIIPTPIHTSTQHILIHSSTTLQSL